MVSTRTSGEIAVLAARGGWIGVDLDGTLFTYHHWTGWNVFGEPIEPMIRRVREWLAAGIEVRVVTARVGLPMVLRKSDRRVHAFSTLKRNFCRVTREPFSDRMMEDAIQDHLEKHGLPRLAVQPHKDVDMIELWDDRAVQVIVNTGRTLSDEHEAQIVALSGRAFQS